MRGRQAAARRHRQARASLVAGREAAPRPARAAQVIIGYTARVDHAKLGRPLEAFTELRFVGSTPVDQIARIAEDIPEVQAVFTTAGDPDALVWIRVKDVADLKRVVDDCAAAGASPAPKTLMVLGTSARVAPAL